VEGGQWKRKFSAASLLGDMKNGMLHFVVREMKIVSEISCLLNESERELDYMK